MKEYYNSAIQIPRNLHVLTVMLHVLMFDFGYEEMLNSSIIFFKSSFQLSVQRNGAVTFNY